MSEIPTELEKKALKLQLRKNSKKGMKFHLKNRKKIAFVVEEAESNISGDESKVMIKNVFKKAQR